MVDASIELEELNPVLDLVLEAEDAQTLGGFLNEQFQHVPKKGEWLDYKNYRFQIQQASSKRIMKVLIFKQPFLPYEPLSISTNDSK